MPAVRVTVGAAVTLFSALATSGCLDGDAEDTGPPCPTDIPSFCLYEFGGSCPTYAEAAAMTCLGGHFNPAADAGDAPFTTDGTGGSDCDYPIVSCTSAADEDYQTRIYFTSTGDGEIEWVSPRWTGDPYCSRVSPFGDIGC